MKLRHVHRLHRPSAMLTSLINKYSSCNTSLSLNNFTCIFSHAKQANFFKNRLQSVKFSISTNFGINNCSFAGICSGADPGFDRGGGQIVTGLNCQWCAAASCKQSEPFSMWGLGSSWVFHY